MQKLFYLFVFISTCGFASSQNTEAGSGDLYHGLTRKIINDRMIPPYGIEVTFDKTTTVIFPSSIASVNLGSANIIAGKYPGAENVLRVQAAVRDFTAETNFSVITDEGSYFSFNVKYAAEPGKLNIEMKDFTHDGSAVNRPNNSLDIYLKELGSESPKLVRLAMKTIYDNNKRKIKHIGSKKFGTEFLLDGIYTYENIIYLHLAIKNSSHIPYDVDFIRMKIADKKVAKRTAIQETPVVPLRAYNHVRRINGKTTEKIVFAIGKVSIPAGKQLVIDLYEKKGGRNQSLTVENKDLLHAERISELKLK